MTDEAIPIGSAKPRKKAQPPPPRIPRGDWRDDLAFDRYHQTRPALGNVITILGNHEAWANVFQWDEFSRIISTTRVPPWDAHDAPEHPEPGEWQKVDTSRAQAWLLRREDLVVGPEVVAAAVQVVAHRKTINPPRSWMESLQWDGVARLDLWLCRYLGVASSEYAMNVGRWTLISSVARIYKPGEKVDTMLILEGPQGALKSTAVRTLWGGDWFSDTPIDLDNKDRFVALRGKTCIEFAELDSMERAEIVRIKSFLSSPIDSYRPPYEPGDVRVPRQCIFVGTVNESTYLKDTTGNRRFWPVKCGEIDIPGLGAAREQLWAEAVHRYKSGRARLAADPNEKLDDYPGERWWARRSEVGDIAIEQAARMVQDAWYDKIAAYAEAQTLKLVEPFITVAEVLGGPFGLEASKWTQMDQNRVARCLLQLGWLHTQRREGERRVRGYIRPPTVDQVSNT